jgi:hypothetical protein
VRASEEHEGLRVAIVRLEGGEAGTSSVHTCPIGQSEPTVAIFRSAIGEPHDASSRAARPHERLVVAAEQPPHREVTATALERRSPTRAPSQSSVTDCAWRRPRLSLPLLVRLVGDEGFQVLEFRDVLARPRKSTRGLRFLPQHRPRTIRWNPCAPRPVPHATLCGRPASTLPPTVHAVSFEPLGSSRRRPSMLRAPDLRTENRQVRARPVFLNRCTRKWKKRPEDAAGNRPEKRQVDSHPVSLGGAQDRVRSLLRSETETRRRCHRGRDDGTPRGCGAGERGTGCRGGLREKDSSGLRGGRVLVRDGGSSKQFAALISFPSPEEGRGADPMRINEEDSGARRIA